MKQEPFVDTDSHIIEIYCTRPSFWPMHFHRHGEIVLVTKGKVEIEINGFTETLERGDLMFIAHYVPHSCCPADGAMRWSITFSLESMGRIGELLLKYHPKRNVIKKEELDEKIPDAEKFISEIQEKTVSNDPLLYAGGFSELCTLIHKLLGITGLLPTDEKKNGVFLAAIKLCEEHYTDEHFTAEILAQKLHISLSALRKMFSKSMNMSVKQYITLLRVGNAEKLLRNTKNHVSSIALSTGFGTIRTFNRIFLKTRGVVPSEYRKSFS